MIQQLISDFTTKYDLIRGSSRILAVFLVALLFLYLFRRKLGYNPIVLILTPLAAVSAALTYVLSEVRGMDHEDNEGTEESPEKKKNKAGSSIIKKLPLIFAAFLCVFAVMLTGERLYSGEHLQSCENLMHIPEDYRQAMDYVLSQNSDPKVLAMPDYSMYNTMYSSHFDMLYEQRSGDDVRYLSEDARNAFNELSDRSPDMLTVSNAASDAGCDYIILLDGHYWPMFPLDEYDYRLEANVAGWDIYSRKEAAND